MNRLWVRPTWCRPLQSSTGSTPGIQRTPASTLGTNASPCHNLCNLSLRISPSVTEHGRQLRRIQGTPASTKKKCYTSFSCLPYLFTVLTLNLFRNAGKSLSMHQSDQSHARVDTAPAHADFGSIGIVTQLEACFCRFRAPADDAAQRQWRPLIPEDVHWVSSFGVTTACVWRPFHKAL